MESKFNVMELYIYNHLLMPNLVLIFKFKSNLISVVHNVNCVISDYYLAWQVYASVVHCSIK